MSFALTTDQVRQRTKTVTRRTGWLFLKPGDRLQPVVKAQGIKKGEQVEKIGGPIEVVSVRRERLQVMAVDIKYGYRETALEGFTGTPYEHPHTFIDFFCATHSCTVRDQVTRIEFTYVEPDAKVGDTKPHEPRRSSNVSGERASRLVKFRRPRGERRLRPSGPRQPSAQYIARAKAWPMGHPVTVLRHDGSFIDTVVCGPPWEVCGSWAILVEPRAGGGVALTQVWERDALLLAPSRGRERVSQAGQGVTGPSSR